MGFAPDAAAQTARIEGTVLDGSGGAVPGATVQLRCGALVASAVTSRTGQFSFESAPAARCTLSVHAAGFEQARKAVTAAANQTLRVVLILSPAVQAQQVNVTAARTQTPLGDTPLSDMQVTAKELRNGSALAVDDSLRQVPGFSLFRRSGSETANPTTQGVSLRGLGASGASRALVLEDGFPLNDPFGGWVFWGRIPRAAVESVEVSQGGASSLYGSDALGGVVQLLTRPSERAGLSVETSYGSENTPDLSLWTGGRAGRWETMAAAELFSTDGYIPVPTSQRGSVDTRASSEHRTADWTIGRRFGSQGRVFGRGWFYQESRHNGTPLQTNSTLFGEGALGADSPLGGFGFLTLRFYGQAQHYEQTFSAVALNRMSERLTDSQVVPEQAVGGSAEWTGSAGKRQTLVAGVDSEEVMGASDELMFASGAPSARLASGGRQRTVGVFGEDLVRLGPNWLVAASVREDHWRNFDARAFRTPIAPPGPPSLAPFASRSENAFSPRLAVVHPLAAGISLSASLYRAFRAPTLNELYRSFRVGNVLTLDNGSLRAERLTGGEAGAGWHAAGGRVDLRGSFFWNDIVNPIANVTLSVQPALITRQRQNLGRTRSAGVELEGVARLTSRWELAAGYQYADAVVVSFPASRALEGLWAPQVPRHVFTIRTSYVRSERFTIAADGRFVGNQFDDDQNLFPLGRFFVLGMTASRALGRGIEVFAAGENLFNARYDIAATPVANLGAPFTARAGIRFQLPHR
ncbi:MAG TPA: TonB-dependent receptor [Candidatus Acidoferrales bacterium]|nr:TonB-dependent receptor [Candidatus Acidoferrales bacterium]